MPKYPRASGVPKDRPEISPEIWKQRLQRMSPDPLVRQCLEYFYRTGAGERIAAAAAEALRPMTSRRDRGSPDFQHQVDDLVHQGWNVFLRNPVRFASEDEFAEAFIKTMINYCDWHRKKSRKVQMSDSPEDIDSPGSQARIVRFPCPERQAADRHALRLLEAAVKSQAPDLGPLLAAITRGETEPEEQAVALGRPVKNIYAMRRRLKRLAARVLDWNE